MKAASMRCEPCPSLDARPSLMSPSARRCGRPLCAAPASKDLAPSCGPSSAWGPSSNACTAFALAGRRSGASLAHLDLARKSLRSGPLSATKMPCAAGSETLGRRLKKSPARRSLDRLCGRVGHQRAPHACAYFGAQGPDTHHPVSLQLEPCFGYRRPDADQLPVSAARGQHQEGRNRRILEGAQCPLETALAGHLGWLEGASQPSGARVPGQLGWTHPNSVLAALRTGLEPSGVPVGLAQAPCAGQLLSQQPERVAQDRAQQAQECAKTPFDHRRLLDAGYAVVMS